MTRGGQREDKERTRGRTRRRPIILQAEAYNIRAQAGAYNIRAQAGA